MFETLPSRQLAIEWVDPRLLVPHPRQISIYGEDDIADLVEAIRASHWIKPLVVTPQNMILSGHRRRQAALALDWPAVPVERWSCSDEVEEVEVMLRENVYRNKTMEQRVREGMERERIEAARSRQRMSEAAKARRCPQGMENLPDPEQGTTRDAVARHVDIGSGRTYEKAVKVVQVADSLSKRGNTVEAQTLLQVLNAQSVDAAARVLALSEPEQRAVLEKLATGQAQRVQAALLEVKKAQIEAQAQAAPRKPRVARASWQEWLPGQPPCDLLLTDPPYMTDVEDIDTFARAWLPHAFAKVKATGHAFVCIGSYPDELNAYLHQHKAGTLPLPLGEVLVWVYHNTLGPQPISATGRPSCTLQAPRPHRWIVRCSPSSLPPWRSTLPTAGSASATTPGKSLTCWQSA